MRPQREDAQASSTGRARDDAAAIPREVGAEAGLSDDRAHLQRAALADGESARIRATARCGASRAPQDSEAARGHCQEWWSAGWRVAAKEPLKKAWTRGCGGDSHETGVVRTGEVGAM